MNKKFLAIWALCCIIFLDGLGMGIIFPLLSPIFWDPHLSILPNSMNTMWHNIWYGVTLSAFAFGMFFSAPMLGDLSDGYGRKKILIIAVFGVGIAYCLSAIAISWHSLTLLIISRMLAGLLSGCQPIAQAAVMDMSEEHEKAKNLSFIFFFASAGFVVGPLLGGCLSNSHWVSWFNLSTPLFAAAIFSITCCFLLKSFRETLTETRAVEIRPLRSLYVLKEAWQNENIRSILLVSFFFQVSWSGFFQVIPAFLGKQYQLNSDMIGYFSSFMSIGFGIAFLGVINFLSTHFQPKKVIWTSLVIIGICLATIIVWQQMAALWLTAIPVGFCAATVFVLLSTLGSNQAGANYQGWFMGANMSVGACAWFISPLINSMLLDSYLFMPIIFSAAMIIISWLIFFTKIMQKSTS